MASEHVHVCHLEGSQLTSAGSLQERGAFTLVLSGGSLLKAIGQLVGSPGVDFSKWHVFFVDERNVPHSHSDSNYKGADEALLSKVRWAR